MTKPTRYEQGFDTAVIAIIVTMLRNSGWHFQEEAKELLRDFKPNMQFAAEDDREVLRDYGLIA